MRNLRDGDRVRLGAYEIEIRLVEDAVARPGTASAGSPFGDPFGMDPFAPSRPQRNAFDEPDHRGPRVAPTAAQLPHDFDPLAPDPAETPFRGPTQADHSPVMEDAFRLPPTVGQAPLNGGAIPADDLLPDDWDKDLLEGGTPPAPPPRPIRKAAAPSRPPEPAPSPSAPPPAPPQPAANDALLTAFLDGAGMPGAKPADPTATMLGLGKAFRDLVAGLRAVLIARAAIKSEFRIEQTMIRARGNNPLKFAADDDDALAALLGTGRRTDMAPHEAVADALHDIRLHELAAMAAMQAAVRSMLDGLDPTRLRASAEQGGGISLLPAQKKARAWDAYEALHARTVRALADDFDSAFGKAFARAYERSLQEASAKDRR